MDHRKTVADTVLGIVDDGIHHEAVVVDNLAFLALEVHHMAVVVDIAAVVVDRHPLLVAEEELELEVEELAMKMYLVVVLN